MSDLAIPSPRRATALDALVAGLARAVRNVGERVAARRALVELSRLDDRTLKDIGYRRADLLAIAFADGLHAGVGGRAWAAPDDAARPFDQAGSPARPSPSR